MVEVVRAGVQKEETMSNVGAEEASLGFEMGWRSWADLPEAVSCDQGSEFRGVFREMCLSRGMQFR